MNYREHLAQDRRLQLLRLLEASPGRAANEGLLQAALAGTGHTVSADLVRGELAWLEEQGLVAVGNGELRVASLTQRGEDVALGRAMHPGVSRGRPL